MTGKIIARGAEAVLSADSLEGRKVLVKDRIKKGYRLPELDSRIRKIRTRGEHRLLDRARRAMVFTPRVFRIEESRLIMEFIEGERVKDVLNTKPKNERFRIYELIGEAVARLHSAGIIHGDLTTSNMILKRQSTDSADSGFQTSDYELYIIDFGLGKSSQRIEDQAVDLFLLYEALKSAHFKYLNESWQYILKTYKRNYSNSAQVLRRLEKIEKRRRYKG